MVWHLDTATSVLSDTLTLLSDSLPLIAYTKITENNPFENRPSQYNRMGGNRSKGWGMNIVYNM